MFKTIVVGTDGSDTAARAVQMAGELAASTDEAVLHIVSVGKGVSRTAAALAETSMAAAGTLAAEGDDDAIKGREDVLKRLRAFRGRLPADFVFGRDEANER